MDVSKTYLPEGTRLQNRYEIREVIGTGGFGITYRAVDLLLNCPVAVKEFFPQELVTRNVDKSLEFTLLEENNRSVVEACRENFRHEARILKAVKDVPYIARRKDYFEENETEYLVLNLISGKSLAEHMREQGGRLPVAAVLKLMKNTADTLEQMHSLGIIHRDISPGNLMLSEDGILYLIDFGAATSYMGAEKLLSRQVFLHRGLDAPECTRLEEQGPWTDIYSFCATMLYLVTGEGLPPADQRLQYDSLPQLLVQSPFSAAQQNALMQGLQMEIARRTQSVQILRAQLYEEKLEEEESPQEWRVFYHAKTMIGSRAVNQDNFMVNTAFCYKGEDCEESGELVCTPGSLQVAAVCDGVGGSNHGELASKAAIQAAIHFVEAYHQSEALPERLIEALLDQMNEKILQLGEVLGQTATTISLMAWKGDRYYIANIGDSPIYLLRKGTLTRLSTPHTRAEQNLMLQKPVQLLDYNTLMQYLGKSGVAGSQMAAVRYGRIKSGDTFLLCSDGVSKKIENSKLKSYLGKKGEKAVPAMFKALQKKDDNDNCTAIVLKF